jgi:hypothetical protein
MFAHRCLKGFAFFQSVAQHSAIAGSRCYPVSLRTVSGLPSLLALILLSALFANARAQNANDGYAPSANDFVQAVVVQPDGKA